MIIDKGGVDLNINSENRRRRIDKLIRVRILKFNLMLIKTKLEMGRCLIEVMNLFED